MVLVFGMMVVGCDNGTTDRGGGNITITGIPATYNGKWAFFSGWSETHLVAGFASLNIQTEVATLVQISGGSVTLPAWRITNAGTVQRFSGNTTVEGTLFISSVQTGTFYYIMEEHFISDYGWETVVFNGGNAMLTWAYGN